MAKTNIQQDWAPLPQEWSKYNTDASKNRKNHKKAISYVCRNANGRIIYKKSSIIGDLPILVAENLSIREALKHAMTEIISELSLRATR